MRNPRSPWLPCLLLALVACGDADAPAEETSQTPVASTSGRLRIDLRWGEGGPVKGDNTVELTFRDAQGAAVEGLEVAVAPWMPAHGHGSSVAPRVMPLGPGAFVASRVNFYMGGAWQLRIATKGALHDSAVAAIDVR